jgi:hypothetical protein
MLRQAQHERMSDRQFISAPRRSQTRPSGHPEERRRRVSKEKNPSSLSA